MEPGYRLYNCQRCRRQVRICVRCDRGHVYCFAGCGESARQESLRRAGRRYQQTHCGAMKHAARQQAYRERHQQKVTHHGFSELVASVTVPAARACAVESATAGGKPRGRFDEYVGCEPRALPFILEGLALWSGQRLCVVIYAEKPVQPSLGLGRAGDEWPDDNPLVEYLFVERRERLR